MMGCEKFRDVGCTSLSEDDFLAGIGFLFEPRRAGIDRGPSLVASGSITVKEW